MTTMLRNSAAFVLAIGLLVIPGSAVAAPGALQCRHSAAEYAQAIKHFEAQFARARTQAEANPLYESDVGYYRSVLSDAQNCLRSLTPVTTASR